MEIIPKSLIYKVLPDCQRDNIRVYNANEFDVTSPQDLAKKIKAFIEEQKAPVPILLDKPLPELKEFGINLSPADVNDKIILISFFDIEQRPSRNCIMKLSEIAQELKSKGIEIVAVHVSNIKQEKIEQLNEKNNISFPIGMIQDNHEETKLNWGVKSLPWLILTDKNHIITVEGFSINELDKKIKDIE